MMRRVILLLAPALVSLLEACGDDDDTAGSAAPASCDVVGDTDAEATSELALTLHEWTIKYEGNAAEAGNVRLEAANAGDVEHELVIEKADGSRIGEIEPFSSGATCAGTFALEPGTYELFCEIVDEGGTSHLDAGMAADLIVK